MHMAILTIEQTEHRHGEWIQKFQKNDAALGSWGCDNFTVSHISP